MYFHYILYSVGVRSYLNYLLKILNKIDRFDIDKIRC